MESEVKFGIRSKIVLGYIIIIACLLASVVLLNHQIKSLQKERNFIINHDSDVHDLTNRIERDILDMETGQRGYVISGDTSYLDPYNKAEDSWGKDYERLNELLKNNPNQQKKLQDIRSTIEHWITTISVPINQLKKDNRTAEIKKFYIAGTGQKDMDSIRDQFDQFRSTERALTQKRATQLDNKNTIITIGLFGILLLICLISIVMASTISRSIVRTIKDVTRVISKIASSKGDLTERINVKTNDEMKELGSATNALLAHIEKREWIQSNIAAILTKYQGISSINTLGEIFLSEITKMTEASFGAFYVREENDEFVKKAAFADSIDDIGRDRFYLGQGLIGQIAKEKRIMTFKEIPRDYHVISTGLGDVQPKGILITPVLFENEVIAVIELASLTEFSMLHQELVSQIVETFGLTVNSIMGRMEIVRLLNESRSMTEELQAQSEELQTQSEELQTQTEESQMQAEELLTINEQLEERTKEAEAKSKELERVKKELEEKADQLLLNSNYKSEFLANMSHELRTPLNSILILSEMLAENGNQDLSEEEVEFARVIHSSGEDLLSLINDILDLSKIEAGKLDVHYGEINMSEVPEQLERTFSPIAKKKNLDFKINKSANVEDVFYTDEKRFQQILKNLLSNAFKFTEEGSVSLNIKKIEDDVLTQEMQMTSSNWLAISVTDTGIGIPKNKQNLIFESFQQADGAMVRKYGGTGLGLSICKEFAKLLGGEIFLKSEVGEGSTFTIIIPSLSEGFSKEREANMAFNEVASTISTVNKERVGADKTIEQDTEALHESKGDTVFKSKNILIVDDDYRNIYALKTTLEKRGMNITVAHDGVECLDILKDNQEIDLILMDIMMPNMDGYETMSRIRTMKTLTNLPIIALTAKAMKHDKEKCLQAGASDYISKPLNLDQLFSVLRVWLVK
ncbi:response regulator [Terrilactibacillus sp. BCM23-1]|uniref:Circadian input-output histidine kinase CikA n=1 Tax=Terrilactibacillus tamarindi TaxID=2599694 RepID=A0A6N8CNT2_9BACI|nr:CHASE3 domain-containing protein [Terrilactibacillus tamarindi]MTT31762.1 response regulator [Terrilactibacillus tamarindi]